MMVSVHFQEMDTQRISILMACLVRIQEWISAFFSFILYVAVLLRVRGNLIQDATGKWSFRWARWESWQLAFARDYLDSSTVKMAAIIVWYACMICVPFTTTRLHDPVVSRYPVSVYCH